MPMKDVPLAILSIDEWRSLTRVCVRTASHSTLRLHDNVVYQLSYDDPHSAKRTLELMMVSNKVYTAGADRSRLKRHQEYS